MARFVICGTYSEFEDWRDKKILDMRAREDFDIRIMEYVYLRTVNQLTGIEHPSGIFCGTWKSREDIQEILFTLHVNSRGANAVIKQLLEEMN